MDEVPTGLQPESPGRLPTRWEPDSSRLLASAIPMTLLAVGCALLAFSGITLAWLGVILLLLGSYRSWLAVLLQSSALELSSTGIRYRHGVQSVLVPWHSLVRCGVVNLSHGARGSDSVRIVWRADDAERVLDVDPAYSNPQAIAHAIANWSTAQPDIPHPRETDSATDQRDGSAALGIPHPRESDSATDQRDGSAALGIAQRVWCTPLLLGMIIAVTGWEFWRWGVDPTVEALARSGGISIGALLRGEWYSIGMANVLHANLLHVGMNCVIIFLLGMVLERSFGGMLVLACAALASITTTVGALAIDNAPVTIGASGIGFALMGCAFAADPRARTGVGVLARQLLPINLLITLLASSIISVGGHLGGLVAGIIVGGVLVRGVAPPRTVPAAGAALLSVTALAGVCTLATWAPSVARWVGEVPGGALVERQLVDRITANGGEAGRVSCAVAHRAPKRPHETSSRMNTMRPMLSGSLTTWKCEIAMKSGADGGPGGSLTAILRFDSPSDQFAVEPLDSDVTAVAQT